jgi:3-oxoacyl-[acyl-carrier-protein] synthase II
MRRIVVTGMGAVSPLACSVELSWRRLLAGQSGLRPLPEWAQVLPARIAGLVPDIAGDAEGGFDPAQAAAPKDQRKMDRFILFALLATAEAVAQAKWTPQDAGALERTATIIGSGVGGFPAMAEAVRITEQRGVRRLSPFTIPSFLANLAAGHVSIRYGYKGPLGTPVTACAAGVQAIGDAARMIRAGEADVAICGGAEACIDIVSLGGFAAARALSSGFNEEPARASRPFDRRRDGFVMGEGAGILVIEALEHALARGARPIAEIVGYGTTADAYHMTSGPPDGEGARRAMEIALRQAKLAPADLQHLNAHATSTRPPATRASSARSPRCSAATAALPSAQPNRPPAICSAPPAVWKRSSPCSPCATRSRRRRSISKTPMRAPMASTSSPAPRGRCRCSMPSPTALASAG